MMTHLTGRKSPEFLLTHIAAIQQTCAQQLDALRVGDPERCLEFEMHGQMLVDASNVAIEHRTKPDSPELREALQTLSDYMPTHWEILGS